MIVTQQLNLQIDGVNCGIEFNQNAKIPLYLTTDFGFGLPYNVEVDELIDMLTQFRDLYRAEQAKGESSDNPIWQSIIEGADDAK